MGWLRETRIAAGVASKDVAGRAGVTQQFYNYIENEKRRPSPEVAKKIAEILGFDWTRFYDEKSVSR